MFDFENIALQGIPLMAMVFGLVEFLKYSFDLTGKKVTVLAASLGAVIFVLFQLITILPEPFGQIITVVFTSVTFGLSASGYYKFVAARVPKTDQ